MPTHLEPTVEIPISKARSLLNWFTKLLQSQILSSAAPADQPSADLTRSLFQDFIQMLTHAIAMTEATPLNSPLDQDNRIGEIAYHGKTLHDARNAAARLDLEVRSLMTLIKLMVQHHDYPTSSAFRNHINGTIELLQHDLFPKIQLHLQEHSKHHRTIVIHDNIQEPSDTYSKTEFDYLIDWLRQIQQCKDYEDMLALLPYLEQKKNDIVSLLFVDQQTQATLHSNYDLEQASEYLALLFDFAPDDNTEDPQDNEN